jgi:LysM repeat protein
MLVDGVLAGPNSPNSRAGEGTKTMASTRANTAIRLTRRGRLVLVVTVMTLLVLAGFTLGHGSSLAASRVPPATHHTVVVEPGETLWAVAVRIAPHVDPRLVVADIESLNHLNSAAVETGQQLRIPTLR